VESGQAEVEITDLKIRVEGDYAYMTGNLGLNGTVLLPYTDESPDIWQKIDGIWYNIETNPMFPGYDPSELP
jgi:ketosteroid isomerase-like protein